MVKVEPANGFGIILDKTEEIVNDILFVHSHNNYRLFKKTNRYLKINKLPGISDDEGGLLFYVPERSFMHRTVPS